MESRAKVAGHPAHPILVVFPLGLLLTSVSFDIIFLFNDNSTMAVVAYWMITAGLLWGVIAAVPGLIDWMAIPAATRAKRIGLFHALGNVAVILLFGLSWWLRTDEPGHQPPTLALICSFAAFAVGGLSGWLGGELVDRLGVGVDPDAHLNAPSSLSGRPAGEMSR
ncbi:DUF2231 domain-containing protein [Spirosoma fluviale]|uniref:Uncharacterized membrane protein n=1 Tax=Spirosoma fluviale TaxID=1597977 RepID=A0A286G377_9BACT|nr:DUF2231 domain-containing protein [Spirosoma fluviale]SOD90000.1 Uncharacterized membrane protein [Spirosoma fluviale]